MWVMTMILHGVAFSRFWHWIVHSHLYFQGKLIYICKGLFCSVQERIGFGKQLVFDADSWNNATRIACVFAWSNMQKLHAQRCAFPGGKVGILKANTLSVTFWLNCSWLYIADTTWRRHSFLCTSRQPHHLGLLSANTRQWWVYRASLGKAPSPKHFTTTCLSTEKSWQIRQGCQLKFEPRFPNSRPALCTILDPARWNVFYLFLFFWMHKPAMFLSSSFLTNLLALLKLP